jgi:hypothetical protein
MRIYKKDRVLGMCEDGRPAVGPLPDNHNEGNWVNTKDLINIKVFLDKIYHLVNSEYMKDEIKMVDPGTNYRLLKSGEEIKNGDQFYNPEWEVDGPWFDIDSEAKGIGVKWQTSFRYVRRMVSKDDK